MNHGARGGGLWSGHGEMVGANGQNWNARANVDSSDHTEPRLRLEHVIPLPQVGDRLGAPDTHSEFKI